MLGLSAAQRRQAADLVLELEDGSVQLAGGLLAVGGVHQVRHGALGSVRERQQGQGALCR